MKGEQKKPKVKPQDTWAFPVKLPSGAEVQVTVKQTTETIDRKAKVQTGVRVMGKDWTIPVTTTARGADGQPITSPVPVRGLRVTVEFSDGKSLTVRSCCKPPDVFQVSVGKRKAMRRLFQLDSGTDVKTGKTNPDHKPRLTGDDRRALYYAVITNGKTREARIKKVEKTAPAKPEGNVAVG